MLIRLLDEVNPSDGSIADGNSAIEESPEEDVSVLGAAKRRLASRPVKNVLCTYICLPDTISALEEVSIGTKYLKGINIFDNTGAYQFSGATEKIRQAFLAHTAYAKKFNNRHAGKGFHWGRTQRTARINALDDEEEHERNDHHRKQARHPNENKGFQGDAPKSGHRGILFSIGSSLLTGSYYPEPILDDGNNTSTGKSNQNYAYETS